MRLFCWREQVEGRCWTRLRTAKRRPVMSACRPQSRHSASPHENLAVQAAAALTKAWRASTNLSNVLRGRKAAARTTVGGQWATVVAILRPPAYYLSQFGAYCSCGAPVLRTGGPAGWPALGRHFKNGCWPPVLVRCKSWTKACGRCGVRCRKRVPRSFSSSC